MPQKMTYGEVTETSPTFKVRFNGSPASAAVEGVLPLSTYTPTVGDTVLLVQVGPTWIALGAL